MSLCPGLLLLLAFLLSASRVAIVNRPRGDRLARGVVWVAHSAIARKALRRRSYDAIQDALAWVRSPDMVLLIMSWFALVQAAFSLLIWSWQAEHSLLQAVIASGSALSTLGFLCYPTCPASFWPSRRARLGSGSSYSSSPSSLVIRPRSRRGRPKLLGFTHAPEPIPRALASSSGCRRSGKADDLTAIWEDWEAWFRLLIETHNTGIGRGIRPDRASWADMADRRRRHP